MSGQGGAWRRHRAAVAANLALLLAAGGLVFYAVSAQGFKTHRAELNDGGIWVTNTRDGYDGRVNKPIGQLDGAALTEPGSELDIVQDGSSVVALDLTKREIAPIDPATATRPDEQTAGIPANAEVQLRGDTLAVLDRSTGALRATRVDPQVGLPPVSSVDVRTGPLLRAGGNAALAVSQSGTVFVVSAERDELTTVSPIRDSWNPPSKAPLEQPVGESVSITTVGETPVVLDDTTGALIAVGGVRAVVEPSSVLQQPGPAAEEVLLATATSLVAVNLTTGELRTVADQVTGRATNPVRLGACSYAAWSGGRGAVLTQCGADEPVRAILRKNASDLVFRVNRGQILLNDRLSGRVWDVDDKVPSRIDDWEAFRTKDNQDNQDPDTDQNQDGDRRPPKAKPDQFGARPGRITVLHPLDNDTAPAGRILAISSVEQVAGNDAGATISPDGQTIQLELPENASGTTKLEYFVNDGREHATAHATVTVTTRVGAQNQPPALRAGFKPRTWPVPPGGSVELPVLPDWRDKRDGDSLALVSATVGQGVGDGASVRTTSTGRLRFTAPNRPGRIRVDYSVTDGLSEPVTTELTFVVQDPARDEAVAAVAEPDIVSVEAGSSIVIRPLANDLPGADPLTPRATLELAGKVAANGGAQVGTDLVDGSIVFRAARASTYTLEYDAAYGNAPLAPGRIRVDVHPRQSRDPVAMPDTATVFGQAATLVDVLANDVDPGGAMLVVQGVRAQSPNQVDVAVVDGRWVRISPRQGQLRPNPQLVRYTLSNGLRSTVGEITVSQRDVPEDNTPVTELDQVTVRAGSAASIPVLDNDFSPSGDALSLVVDSVGEKAGQLTVRGGDGQASSGQAFVAGRLVRYVAPARVQAPATYDVDYVATNSQGETAPGRIEVTVIPESRPNRSPEPPVLEGRVVSGGMVTLKLPGAGVDPDGDAVSLVGLASAPRLGRVLKLGANSIQYQAFPGSTGTEEFQYLLTDSFGGQAVGTVRVAVAAPDSLQAPLAVPDTMTVEPGRLATVDPMANDLVAAGDRASIELVDPPAGVTLDSATGPVVITAPARANGRNIEVVYRLSNGLATSQSTITLRTATPYNNPPIVFDAFGRSSDSKSVRVDVLRTAYDPDGPTERLRITDVFAPAGVTASVGRGQITVTRGPQPLVIPFRVEDADGGAALAQVYVPATGSGLPYVKRGALIKLAPGETVEERLADYVVNPAGGPVTFAAAGEVLAAPAGRVDASATGESTFSVSASEAYTGPAAVTFEVTVGSDQKADAARTMFLSVPAEVGKPAPTLTCPEDAVLVPQGGSVELDIVTLCRVFTSDPRDLASLDFVADWGRSVDGLAIIQPTGTPIVVAARQNAKSGSEGLLLVRAGNSLPGRIRIRVGAAPPPTLSPIRISDLLAGESRTVDLAPYLTTSVPNPSPTFVRVSQLSGPPMTVSPAGGAAVRIAAGARDAGIAEFRVTLSDVGSTTREERQASNVLTVDLLGVPDAPRPPVPGSTVRNGEVHLDWRAPDAHGSPIDSYEVRVSNGATRRCATTSCDITGLTNGTVYTFTVRAHNAVGWSDLSGRSRGASPDAVPGQVGQIRLKHSGDRQLSIGWSAPTTQTSRVTSYRVSWAGHTSVTDSPSFTVSGLDNNRTYRFTVVAVNAKGAGPARTSAPFQSAGPPGTPKAPRVDAVYAPNGTATLVVSWPPVQANGGTQPKYNLLYDGSTDSGCENSPLTTCTITDVVYDGRVHTFAVRAVTGRDLSATGAVATWQAIASPLPWGAWTLEPTGTDDMARATFTVPRSLGRDSLVSIKVDGHRVVDGVDLTGPQVRSFSVGDNDGEHEVALGVCNESDRCSWSDPKSVQTYGDLKPSHILSIEPRLDGTKLSWEIAVDTNGAPAVVLVTSNRRPSVSYNLTTVDRDSVSTGFLDLGFSVTERITVRLEDPVLGRGAVEKDAAATTEDAPPEEVKVTRGSKCNDDPDSGQPKCNVDGQGDDCLDPSCGFIRIDVANFFAPVSCELTREGVIVSVTVGPFPDNSFIDTDVYYGVPGNWVKASCENATADRFGNDKLFWPGG